MLATAAKRKLQRVQGALDALDTLASNEVDYAKSMVEAEAAVRQAHKELTGMLEQTDGGDTLKRARNEWYEASAQTDYVRLHDGLSQYRPAVEAEEAEALSLWEQMQPWRAKIRQAKMTLAKLQGRLYSLLELGFKLPEQLQSAVTQQRAMWTEERQRTEGLMEEQTDVVNKRRERHQQFHREQGWRKAVERFGGLLGLGPAALLAVRLQVLEADEIELRAVCKARVRVLDHSVQASRKRRLLQMRGSSSVVSRITHVCYSLSHPCDTLCYRCTRAPRRSCLARRGRSASSRSSRSRPPPRSCCGRRSTRSPSSSRCPGAVTQEPCDGRVTAT